MKYGYISEYYEKITSGEIIAGRWIKALYEKIVRELDGQSFSYVEKKADKAIKFIETFCRHHEGALAPDLITLELWQKAFISILFGIMDEDGNRQFRECFVVMGRKNGKTLLAAAISAYMAFMDGEYGARIYFSAPKLEQADLCFNAFYQMITKEPELSQISKKRRSDIYIELSNTTAKPLAFSEKKSDGLNVSLCVADEIASWPSEQGMKFYEVLKSSFGSRRQPLLLCISTAGYVVDGPFDELVKRSTSWLLESSKETRLLPVIYQIDDVERWNDIDELKKANPNLGVSVTEKYLKEEAAIAESSMPRHAEFLVKYCNIKQNSTTAWLPYKVVDDCCGEEYSLDDFKSSYCVGGIDLSQTTDLTSCCVIIEKNEKLYTFSKFFMPSNKIDELQEREGVPYRIYQRMGLLQASGENFVDYNDCFNWFRELVENYEIFPLQVGYDRYSAQYLVQQMSSCGFHMDDVFQGENLTSVIREADGLLRDRKLLLGTNNLLKAHFLNVAMKQNDETRKIRPVKIEQRCHIDGFVAVIDALTVRQKWFDEIGEQLKNN